MEMAPSWASELQTFSEILNLKGTSQELKEKRNSFFDEISRVESCRTEKRAAFSFFLHSGVTSKLFEVAEDETAGEGCKKTSVFFLGLCPKAMGTWGSKVLNFLVKIHIKLFVLQTSRNVLKHMIQKWGGHIWPFHDALRPHRFLTVRDRQKKCGFF